MIDTWIQFGILLLAFLGFALRNEHRMTKVEDAVCDIKERVITLERKRL